MTQKTIAFLKCFLASVVILTLSACATTKRDWQKANQLGTIEAYEIFLQEHPNAAQANKAKSLISGLQADEDWGKAEATDTIDAYNIFLYKHPQSKHSPQAEKNLELLRFENAKASDSIVAYESYLILHPKGFAFSDAQKRLRQLRYNSATEQKTVKAYEAFLAQYTEGSDVDTLKAELPALRLLEPSLILGREIMRYAPSAFVDRWTGRMVTERRDPTSEQLYNLEQKLSAGADPNAVRVSGFSPPRESCNPCASSTPPSDGGRHTTYEVWIFSPGTPGRIVPAEKGGMTLLEYCWKNRLISIARLLAEYGAK